MLKTKAVSSSGMSIFTILTIIFIVLKMTNNISWSWWWVWSPTIAYTVFLILFFALYGLLAYFIEINREKSRGDHFRNLRERNSQRKF